MIFFRKIQSMERESLLKRVKQTLQEIEPDAQIILFGSRARAEAVPDSSDWDFLILVDDSVDDIRKDRIRHRLYEIEWDTDEVLSSIIYNRQEWNSNHFQKLPLHINVEKEGLVV